MLVVLLTAHTTHVRDQQYYLKAKFTIQSLELIASFESITLVYVLNLHDTYIKSAY